MHVRTQLFFTYKCTSISNASFNSLGSPARMSAKPTFHTLFSLLLQCFGFYWVFPVALYTLSVLQCELAILQLLQPDNPDSRASGLLPMPPVALSFPSRAPLSICSSHWQFWRRGSVSRLSLCFLRGLCKFYYCALGLHISWVLATSLTAQGSDSSRVLSQMAARVCLFTSVPTERDAQ